METSDNTTHSGGVLVSDFDGTMTRRDFYQLAIEALLPADVPDYWAEYRAGTLTHFEALRRYFAAIPVSEEEVLAVVQRMELDPQLARRPFSRDQRTIVVYGMLVFVLIVVILQLWLLTATMNAWLGGDDSVVWPAAAVSAAGFALNAGLLNYLGRIERTRRLGE